MESRRRRPAGALRAAGRSVRMSVRLMSRATWSVGRAAHRVAAARRHARRADA